MMPAIIHTESATPLFSLCLHGHRISYDEKENA